MQYVPLEELDTYEVAPGVRDLQVQAPGYCDSDWIAKLSHMVDEPTKSARCAPGVLRLARDR